MRNSEQNKLKTFFQKFSYSKGIRIFSVVVFIVSTLAFAVLSYYTSSYSVQTVINSEESENSQTISYHNYNIMSTAKEVCVVVSSGLGINLLLSMILEKSNMNKAYEEFFHEEIISAPSFYESLQEEEKKKMHNALASHLYFEGSSIKKEMHSSIINKLKSSHGKEYVFKECEYNIYCNIQSDYIIKTITKTVKILPYEYTKRIKKYVLLVNHAAELEEYDNVKLKSVKIDNKVIDINDPKEIECKSSTSNSELDKKRGYKDVKTFMLKKDLVFQEVKNKYKAIPKTIEITYETKVPISDLSYICRMSTACEKFSFNFEIENNKDYFINAFAFGFIDDGQNATNVDNHNVVRLRFDDWIFPGDGVAVSIGKHNKSQNT